MSDFDLSPKQGTHACSKHPAIVVCRRDRVCLTCQVLCCSQSCHAERKRPCHSSRATFPRGAGSAPGWVRAVCLGAGYLPSLTHHVLSQTTITITFPLDRALPRTT